MKIENKHIFALLILLIIGYVVYEAFFEKQIKDYFKKGKGNEKDNDESDFPPQRGVLSGPLYSGTGPTLGSGPMPPIPPTPPPTPTPPTPTPPAPHPPHHHHYRRRYPYPYYYPYPYPYYEQPTQVILTDANPSCYKVVDGECKTKPEYIKYLKEYLKEIKSIYLTAMNKGQRLDAIKYRNKYKKVKNALDAELVSIV